MATGTHVWLANPSSGDLWECPNDEAVLAYYLARGWTHSDPPAEDVVEPAPEPVTKPTPKKRSTN